ncbi:alpha/beta hydrolase [bacterium]|nr:alpha/beta hydrolase [bacterium]
MMTRVSAFLIAAVLLLTTVTARCAEQPPIPIWPHQSAADIGASEKIIPLQTKGDFAVTSITVPTLRAFLPKPAKATGAAVIICPGGAYLREVPVKEGEEVARWLNSIGVAGFVLKYRLPDCKVEAGLDPFPQQDAKRAMRLVRSQAARFGLDPSRIGIMGFSAGGHLAASVGVMFDDGRPDAADPVERLSCRPDFLVLVYPVISMEPGVTHANSRYRLIGANPSPDLVWEFSADRQVTPRTPPTFLTSSTDDPVVPIENSIRFISALHAAGVPAEAHFYDFNQHGYGTRASLAPIASTWPARLHDWLRGRGLLNMK